MRAAASTGSSQQQGADIAASAAATSSPLGPTLFHPQDQQALASYMQFLEHMAKLKPKTRDVYRTAFIKFINYLRQQDRSFSLAKVLRWVSPGVGDSCPLPSPE